MANLPARSWCAAGLCAIAGLTTGFATPADAAFELQIDLNSLTATYTPAAGGAFSTSATGTITVTGDANSYLGGLKLDGSGVTPTSTLMSFSGTIQLNAGSVVGGSLDVLLADNSRYMTSITANSGQVVTQAGQGFAIDGLTFGGQFFDLVGGNLFGGADVSGLGSSNLPGTFFLFAFKPNAQGVDIDTDIDIWVVPTPASMALFGVAGVIGASRRRRA